MTNIATVVSKYYIDRILSLINSLSKFDITLHILCYDTEIYNYLKNNIHNQIKLYHLEEIYKFDNDLKKKIYELELINQVVSSRPVFIKYLNEKKNLHTLFLIDADTYFFSDPIKIIDEAKNYSIAFCRHNFVRKKEELEKKYGIYNAGFIYFNLDRNGKEFLNRWSNLCKEWCLFKAEDGKFSDQKYLETLYFEMSNNIKIINNPGVNLAPWNLENKLIEKKNGELYVNKNKIIFFHYHGIRTFSKFIYFLGVSGYRFRISNQIKNLIYKDYLSLLILYGKNKNLYWKHSYSYNLHEINFLKVIRKAINFIKKIIYNDYKIYFWNFK
jgi:hypothetical protein